MVGSGLMGGSMVKDLFSQPKAPTITPPPSGNPKEDEKQAAQAAKKRRDMYANVGRSSTILTGPDGVTAPPADSAAPKSLLGL